MATTPPVPPPPAGPLELTQAVITAALTCANATTDAITQARATVATGKDLQLAGALAATAQQSALATKALCAALSSVQGPGPLRAVQGTPPPMYEPLPDPPPAPDPASAP